MTYSSVLLFEHYLRLAFTNYNVFTKTIVAGNVNHLHIREDN